MADLLVATRNQGKLREFMQLFADLKLRLLSLDDVGITTEVEEYGTTFAANAQLKAEGYARLSGLPTLSDDSGLEVAALGGAPGVYSARYGGVTGAAQLEYLLKQLADTPATERQAQFTCVIALARPGGPTEFVEGALAGTIAFAPQGTGGFGYDPVFVLEGTTTVAEIPAERKNAISHRAVAARKARAVLARWQAEGIL